ncbi:DUF6193 family natural product biosynthesis protein [Nonomuraea pusilla]|uniref:DUF6193 family natural product biosynthesis protein n=1 Tax=Nonomuraea pusilla TaxID=46177 RepID=UPI00332601C8
MTAAALEAVAAELGLELGGIVSGDSDPLGWAAVASVDASVIGSGSCATPSNGGSLSVGGAEASSLSPERHRTSGRSPKLRVCGGVGAGSPRFSGRRHSWRSARLLPVLSHWSLHFSVCTGYPCVWNIPFVDPLSDGRYRVRMRLSG